MYFQNARANSEARKLPSTESCKAEMLSMCHLTTAPVDEQGEDSGKRFSDGDLRLSK